MIMAVAIGPDKIPQVSHGKLYWKFRHRIQYPEYFDNECFTYRLTEDEAIRKLCKCGHISKRHHWRRKEYDEDGPDSTRWIAPCTISRCKCRFWRREISWQEIQNAFAPPSRKKIPKLTPERLEKIRRKSALLLRMQEADWMAYVNEQMGPRKSPESIQFKQHAECKLFRCLKCWKLILPDDNMQSYKDGYVHKICMTYRQTEITSPSSPSLTELNSSV